MGLAAAGCAIREPPRPAFLPVASDAVARIRARKLLPAYRALVAIEVRVAPAAGGLLGDEFGRQGASYAGRAVLLWKSPASLRLEPLSPLGAPLFVVVAKEEELRAFSAARGRYYFGRADAEGMARLVGVPLESALLVRLLQGALPVLGGTQPEGAHLGWDEDAGGARLELPPGAGLGRRQVVWLDPVAWVPRSARIGEEGAAVEVRYGPFRRLGVGSLPEWMEVTGPRGVGRMRIEFSLSDEAGEAEIPDGLFELPIPRGALVVPLDGGR